MSIFAGLWMIGAEPEYLKPNCPPRESALSTSNWRVDCVSVPMVRPSIVAGARGVAYPSDGEFRGAIAPLSMYIQRPTDRTVPRRCSVPPERSLSARSAHKGGWGLKYARMAPGPLLYTHFLPL